EILGRDPDRHPARTAFEARGVVGHRARARGLILLVAPGDRTEEEGYPAHVRGEGPDLIERGGEGDDAVPRDPAVRGLEPDAADEGGRLADGAASIGSQRACD